MEPLSFRLSIPVLVSRLVVGLALIVAAIDRHVWQFALFGVLAVMFGFVGNVAVRTIVDSTGIGQRTPSRVRQVEWRDVTAITVVRLGLARRLKIEQSGSGKPLFPVAPQSSPLGWDREFDKKVQSIRSVAARYGPPLLPFDDAGSEGHFT